MIRSWIGLAIAAVGGFGLVPSIAHAVTVSDTYQGHVNSIDSHLATQFALGDTFNVDLTYETEFGTDSASSPAIGIYDFVLTSMTATLGSHTFTLDPGAIPNSVRIDNDSLGRDLFIVNAGPLGSQINGYDPVNVNIFLQDDTHALFSDDSLPQSTLAAALFTSGTIEFEVFDGSGELPNYYSVRAKVDIPAATPLPPTLPLFISAVGGLGWFGWKRRKMPAA
jgi:hypothetical protein